MKPLPSERSDAALMACSAQGDRAAYDCIAERHLARLWRLAYRITGSEADADEIAQEALLRGWRSAGRYDPARGTLPAWLNRIALNLAADRVRATGMSPAPLLETIPDPAPLPGALLEAREAQAHLAEGVAALPGRQREAVMLAYLQARSGAEAAAALGISVRALEGLLHRARRSLRAWLATAGEEARS